MHSESQVKQGRSLHRQRLLHPYLWKCVKGHVMLLDFIIIIIIIIISIMRQKETELLHAVRSIHFAFNTSLAALGSFATKSFRPSPIAYQMNDGTPMAAVSTEKMLFKSSLQTLWRQGSTLEKLGNRSLCHMEVAPTDLSLQV